MPRIRYVASLLFAMAVASTTALCPYGCASGDKGGQGAAYAIAAAVVVLDIDELSKNPSTENMDRLLDDLSDVVALAPEGQTRDMAINVLASLRERVAAGEKIEDLVKDKRAILALLRDALRPHTEQGK